MEYQGAARRLLLLAKEQSRPELLPVFAKMLHCRLQVLQQSGLLNAATITAVPSARESRLRRGFYPSELLANALARQAQLPYRKLLSRKLSLGSNTKSWQRRTRQVRAAGRYSLKKAPPQGPILLVDDVITTGASLRACALILKSAGACKIFAMTWARTPFSVV